MKFSEIRRLVQLVETSQISELEIEEEGSRVRILKNSTPSAGLPPNLFVQTMDPRSQQAFVPASPTEVFPGRSAETAPEPVVKANIVEVTAPMVGTFYRAQSPEAPPYVHNGDLIKPGQVLCILEAMKLMNEIESEVSGRIVEIGVENAQPVEYGQLLFKVEQD